MSGEVRKGTGFEAGGEPDGFTVRRLLCETPLRVAVIVAVEITETADVVSVKVALVKPGGTVTVSGAWTAELPLETAMTAPPAGAGPTSVMVPLEFVPPVTVGGFSVSKLGARGVPGGTTVRRTLCDVPL
jgi:hypothetical protein